MTLNNDGNKGPEGVRKERMNSELLEKVFSDFWFIADEEVRKERLAQALLPLKKRELYRQYASLIAMIPFALFMATELLAVCSDSVLLGMISAGLSHALLPFAIMSLICTFYLIYNNKKIAQAEQELNIGLNLDNEKQKEKSNIYYTNLFFNCGEILAAILVIASELIAEASPLKELEVVEDVFLFFASFISLCIACHHYRESEKKEIKSEQKKTEKNHEGPSNIPVSGLMLTGSTILLLRRILLMTLVSSPLTPIVGSTLGLLGIAFLIIGSGLAIHSCKNQLTDVEVSSPQGGLGKVLMG